MVTARAGLTPQIEVSEEAAVIPFPLKTHLEGRPWSAEYESNLIPETIKKVENRTKSVEETTNLLKSVIISPET